MKKRLNKKLRPKSEEKVIGAENFRMSIRETLKEMTLEELVEWSGNHSDKTSFNLVQEELKHRDASGKRIDELRASNGEMKQMNDMENKMNEKKTKLMALKVEQKLLDKIANDHKNYVLTTGDIITKSEYIRRLLENVVNPLAKYTEEEVLSALSKLEVDLMKQEIELRASNGDK